MSVLNTRYLANFVLFNLQTVSLHMRTLRIWTLSHYPLACARLPGNTQPSWMLWQFLLASVLCFHSAELLPLLTGDKCLISLGLCSAELHIKSRSLFCASGYFQLCFQGTAKDGLSVMGWIVSPLNSWILCHANIDYSKQYYGHLFIFYIPN